MSALESDIRFYGSANMPDVDGTTTGGAVDMTKKISFADLTAGLVDYVSDIVTDTATVITITYRDSTGAKLTENKMINGLTLVAGVVTVERLLKGVVSGTAPTGNVAALSHTKVLTGRTAQGGGAAAGSEAPYIFLQSGDGASVAVGQIVRIANNTPAGIQSKMAQIIRIGSGAEVDKVFLSNSFGFTPTAATTYDVHNGFFFDVAPNRVVEVRRPFYDAASDVPGGSSRTYNEKIFAVNNNTTIAMTNAVISKQLDPSAGSFQFALTTVLNDTGTVASRLTTPGSGIGSYTTGSSPQSVNVPAPQNLAPGAAPNAAGAQGIWLALTLTAGLAAAKTSMDMRGQGNSI